MKFVVTGVMDHLGREQVEDLIMKYGGKVRNVDCRIMERIAKVEVRITIEKRIVSLIVFIFMFKYLFLCELREIEKERSRK